MLSSRIANPRRWLLFVQCILAIYLVGALGMFFLVQHQLLHIGKASIPPGVVFSLLALAGGTLGGLHFSLGVMVFSNQAGNSAFIGPKLYALDLLGATTGVVAVSLFILPVYGLVVTMMALAVLCMAGALTLFRSPVKGEW
jgi:predicted membrane-bound spermidine synthase